MSALPTLPLLSYQADWEQTFDDASARLESLRKQVNDPWFEALPDTARERLQDEYYELGASLSAIFETQFRTTDDYRDWRLRWFPATFYAGDDGNYQMPAGLPVREIRRRLDEASRLCLDPYDKPLSPDTRLKIRNILSAPPSAEVAALADALRRLGGDRVREIEERLLETGRSPITNLVVLRPGQATPFKHEGSGV